jgi:hypothetical protein
MLDLLWYTLPVVTDANLDQPEFFSLSSPLRQTTISLLLLPLYNNTRTSLLLRSERVGSLVIERTITCCAY